MACRKIALIPPVGVSEALQVDAGVVSFIAPARRYISVDCAWGCDDGDNWGVEWVSKNNEWDSNIEHEVDISVEVERRNRDAKSRKYPQPGDDMRCAIAVTPMLDEDGDYLFSWDSPGGQLHSEVVDRASELARPDASR